VAAPPESLEVREVRDRVVGQYLPAWCASHFRPESLDPSAFKPPDWAFLTLGLAHWFLTAIDEGFVEVSDGGFRCGSSWSEGIFEQGPKATSPRQSKLRNESFFEIAAVGMLACRYSWPVERLRFQPPGMALDFLAYVNDDWNRSEVAIAGEAKRLQKDAVVLSESLKVCGGRGRHDEADCPEGKNHHRKYLGLLKYRPRILWIVGPGAFTAADPDLVFRVEESSGGIVRLHPINARELTFPNP
jgi:hypothetical protein